MLDIKLYFKISFSTNSPFPVIDKFISMAGSSQKKQLSIYNKEEAKEQYLFMDFDMLLCF